jgi:hypothetical protein
MFRTGLVRHLPAAWQPKIHQLVRPIADGMRVAHAIPGIWDYIRKDERIDASLSLFSATSFDVVRSLPAQYSVVLANGTSQLLSRKILIDIYKRDLPVHPEGHHAWFVKSFHLLPGRSYDITITYDWVKHACFALDGVALPPDDHWLGDCHGLGRYAIHAVLSDGSGNQLEHLFIVQDLKS